MIRRPPRSTLSSSSAASDVYKRQLPSLVVGGGELVRGGFPRVHDGGDQSERLGAGGVVVDPVLDHAHRDVSGQLQVAADVGQSDPGAPAPDTLADDLGQVGPVG